METTQVGDLEIRTESSIVAELSERNRALGRLVLERNGNVAGAGIIVAIR